MASQTSINVTSSPLEPEILDIKDESPKGKVMFNDFTSDSKSKPKLDFNSELERNQKSQRHRKDA